MDREISKMRLPQKYKS